MASVGNSKRGGKRGPTSHDVADRAGVSQSTVSRALSGDPNVSEVTRQRVIAAAQALNYSPDTIARSLITRRTNRIGVVISDITNPFYPLLVERLDRDLGDLGYTMLLFKHEKSIERELISHFVSRSVDGLIFTSAELDLPLAPELHSAEVPVIFLNRYIDDEGFDRVVSDNLAGGRRAGELLAELGHRRIALVSGPPETSTARDRDEGFVGALSELGQPIAAELRMSGPYEHETGVRACRELLSLDDPPSAIFCGNDVIALGVWDAAISAGVRIPEDLSVLGFDDIDIASWNSIALTTIRQPLTEMAHASAEMLVERLEGSYSGAARKRLFPTELIFRRTIGPCR
ncbi:MAG TPA: LacI family DNA-binding transcriptional regulator [Solirubrobacterales bacterium]